MFMLLGSVNHGQAYAYVASVNLAYAYVPSVNQALFKALAWGLPAH